MSPSQSLIHIWNIVIILITIALYNDAIYDHLAHPYGVWYVLNFDWLMDLMTKHPNKKKWWFI